jgi:dynein heavy chain 1
MLSAVSQQIQSLQHGLQEIASNVELLGRNVPLHPNVGVFITMNPGYAGRTTLPDNLKSLFRSCAMVVPDREKIANVMLFSQGFQHAEALSRKIVPLYIMLLEQLSHQPHYDFGLRQLKSTLTMAGSVMKMITEEQDRRKTKKYRSTPEKPIETLKGMEKEEDDEDDISSYDFEKSVLVKCIENTIAPKLSKNDTILFRSLINVVFPPTVGKAGVSFASLTAFSSSPFEGEESVQDEGLAATLTSSGDKTLRNIAVSVCEKHFLVPSDAFLDKIIQLHHIQSIHHGIMLVGGAGSGKTCTFNVYVEALDELESMKTRIYLIDPKTMTKEDLYGFMDSSSHEWRDGIFTSIIRNIVELSAGESFAQPEPGTLKGQSSKSQMETPALNRQSSSHLKLLASNTKTEAPRQIQARHWIMFDGAVDPDWVENLNSVLDDNKLFTLPNGERFPLPSTTRIVFEVNDLCNATLATVSRCGIIAFPDDYVPAQSNLRKYINLLQAFPLSRLGDVNAGAFPVANDISSDDALLSSNSMKIQKLFIKEVAPLCLGEESVFQQTLRFVQHHQSDFAQHICFSNVALNSDGFGNSNFIGSFIAFFTAGISTMIDVINSNTGKTREVISEDTLKLFLARHFAYSIIWGIGGSFPPALRSQLGEFLQQKMSIPLPISQKSLSDFSVTCPSGDLKLWMELAHERRNSLLRSLVGIGSGNIPVIPTSDTICHEQFINQLLITSPSSPFLMYGMPGSGKYMALRNAIQSRPDFEILYIPFSNTTQPSDIIKALLTRCRLISSPEFDTLKPLDSTSSQSLNLKMLILYCDDVNLAAPDKYGTPRVISLLRQLVEKRGFWMCSSCSPPSSSSLSGGKWVKLERILVVCSCNPPTLAGRFPISLRFLRHLPILYMDYPSNHNLINIYSLLIGAVFHNTPELLETAGSFSQALVSIYTKASEHFAQSGRVHYVFTPRMLTFFINSLALFIHHHSPSYMQIWELTFPPLSQTDDLLMFCIHECFRIFRDFLTSYTERVWIEKVVVDAFRNEIRSISIPDIVNNSVLFSAIRSHALMRMDRSDLRSFLEESLKKFNEEEQECQLVLFDSVIDHILHIERVLNMSDSHLLLVGASGCGKDILARFVGWQMGMMICDFHASHKQGLEIFDDELRSVMHSAGVKNKKVCLVLKQSQMVNHVFLERVNTFITSGEIPGLFVGEKLTGLINGTREALKTEVSSFTGGGSGGQTEGSIAGQVNPAAAVLSGSDDELYSWFVSRVRSNLHIILTLNPATPDFESVMSNNPSFLTRCAIDWIGDWEMSALHHVAGVNLIPLQLDQSFVCLFII